MHRQHAAHARLDRALGHSRLRGPPPPHRPPGLSGAAPAAQGVRRALRRAAHSGTQNQEAGQERRRVPDRDLSRRDRGDRPRADGPAEQYRGGHCPRSGLRRAGAGGRDHGRRALYRQRDAHGRVQHLGRSGGRRERAQGRLPARRARAPGRYPSGARVGRQLRAASCAGHHGRGGGGAFHRKADLRLRCQPAYVGARRRPGPRRLVRRLPREAGHHRLQAPSCRRGDHGAPRRSDAR